MGAEQSSANKRNTPTKDDIQRALEAQRKLYEQRFQEMLQVQAQTTRQTVETAVKKANAVAQKETFVVIRPTGHREGSSSIPAQSTHSPLPATVPNRTSTSNETNQLERNRSPYNFCSAELQSRVTRAHRTGLYPDLNENLPTASTSTMPAKSNIQDSKSRRPKSPLQRDMPKPSAPPLPSSREASRSRGRNCTDDELKCPTCKNIYTLTLFNCQEGHSSCKHCKQRGAACGICGRGITDRRNITLEAYVCERKIPCQNEGCMLTVKLVDMETHAKECPFKLLQCPLNNLVGYCNWRGKLNHLVGHFDGLHSAQRQAEEGKEMCLSNILRTEKYVYLILKGNFNFLFHVWVSQADNMIYMVTQLIGTAFSAQKWTYDIHLYNKRAPRKKYEFTDTCKSAAVDVRDLFKEANCACIPLPYASHFVNENQVCFKFFISKQTPERGNFHNNRRGRGGRRNN